MSCASGGAGEPQWKKAGFDSSQHFRLVGLFFSSLLLPRFSLTHYVHEVNGQERYDHHRHSGTEADGGYILVHTSMIADTKKKEHGESCPDS